MAYSGGWRVVLKEEIREGYYRDKYGNWRPDRRKGGDRRNTGSGGFPLQHERRKMFRRKVDRELLQKDHKTMINEALEDFAEEHEGHL